MRLLLLLRCSQNVFVLFHYGGARKVGVWVDILYLSITGSLRAFVGYKASMSALRQSDRGDLRLL